MNTSTRLTALDGMRGVAAVGVAMYHAYPILGNNAPFGKGYLAVDFFFMLSGFVLARAYDGRFGNGMTADDFLRRRFARLAPLYWIGCAIGLIYLIVAKSDVGEPGVTAIAANALLLPFNAPSLSENLFPLNPPGWSLFFELLIANLVFAVFWPWLTTRVLLIVNVLSALALLQALHLAGADTGFTLDNFVFGGPRVICSFFIGVTVYRVHHILPTIRIPAVVLTMALVGCLAPNLTGAVSKAFDALCVLIVFPALVHLGAKASEISPRAGFLLGETSYALYAIHFPILQLIAYKTGTAWTVPAQFAVVIAISGASWILVKVFDDPIQTALAERRRLRSAAVGRSASPSFRGG